MKKRTWALIIVLILLGGALLLMFLPNNDFDSYADVRYGEHERNVMDIYLPHKIEDMNEPAPVFMYIHGGGWTTGDKSDGAGWREAMQHIGCVLVTINYRFISPGDPGSIRCDDMIDDVQAAVQYLKDNADRYMIDTTGMAIGGDSAGAHLSLLYSYSRDSAIPVKVVMSRVGPADLTDPEFYKVHGSTGNPDHDGQAMTPELATLLVNTLAGTSYTEVQLSGQSQDPHSGLAGLKGISPLHYVDGKTSIPRTLLGYGGKDNVVPASQMERFSKELTDRGFVEGTDFARFLFPNSWHNLADPSDDDIAKAFMNTFLVFLHEELGAKYAQI